MATLNFTQNNIEHHAKTAKTEPKHHTETKTAAQKQAEKSNFHRKKFFCTHTNRPTDNNGYIFNNPSSQRRLGNGGVVV